MTAALVCRLVSVSAFSFQLGDSCAKPRRRNSCLLCANRIVCTNNLRAGWPTAALHSINPRLLLLHRSAFFFNTARFHCRHILPFPIPPIILALGRRGCVREASAPKCTPHRSSPQSQDILFRQIAAFFKIYLFHKTSCSDISLFTYEGDASISASRVRRNIHTCDLGSWL